MKLRIEYLISEYLESESENSAISTSLIIISIIHRIPTGHVDKLL